MSRLVSRWKLGVNIKAQSRPISILVADDDTEDQMMIADALKENNLAVHLRFVKDGVELMDTLFNRGSYTDVSKHPRPDMILLDLNMPRKDGREALAEIKSHPILRSIPVVVLTTSNTEADISRTYNLGVNSFVTKPVTFTEFVTMLKGLGRYWFEIVELP